MNLLDRPPDLSLDVSVECNPVLVSFTGIPWVVVIFTSVVIMDMVEFTSLDVVTEFNFGWSVDAGLALIVFDIFVLMREIVPFALAFLVNIKDVDGLGLFVTCPLLFVECLADVTGIDRFVVFTFTPFLFAGLLEDLTGINVLFPLADTPLESLVDGAGENDDAADGNGRIVCVSTPLIVAGEGCVVCFAFFVIILLLPVNLDDNVVEWIIPLVVTLTFLFVEVIVEDNGVERLVTFVVGIVAVRLCCVVVLVVEEEVTTYLVELIPFVATPLGLVDGVDEDWI